MFIELSYIKFEYLPKHNNKLAITYLINKLMTKRLTISRGFLKSSSQLRSLDY